MLDRYPTDLGDSQWAVLEPLSPLAKSGGRPRATAMREGLNAILYTLRSGCQWRLPPSDFPPYQTVCDRFRGGGLPRLGSSRMTPCVEIYAKRVAETAPLVRGSSIAKRPRPRNKEEPAVTMGPSEHAGVKDTSSLMSWACYWL